ncbi:myo-inositol 2-dehydrogenase [Kocuria dechangensis]|uniref:Myo-inositol 2-dehydrogenase n=1 Tax=Kocuria dechangensis TaxID=1176249 RepID=A0A917M1A8_9MICC|nr:Gfo/Idh/MocA family oxidoreductase [Kocuria dechangensis]GGG68899.1 myo-inositol 2-dehydrogenase [Kocuria dechangensis]
MSEPRTLNVGLIGAGRIGSSHAELIARTVPNAQLVAIADPVEGVAARLAEQLHVPAAYTDPAQLLADPQVEAVVITAPARFHTGLVEQAAAAGKAIFCEKPAGMTLEDIDRVQQAVEAHGVLFRIGFNRRFADGFPQARAVIEAGRIGTPQLLRSTTRDPGLANPAAVAPWTIFLETLIHDFDTLNFLNPGARAVQVYAVADALVAPEYKDAGLLDTAVVTIRCDNGAIATAEASFSAAYGYDTRAEAFGSGGMVTAGDLAASTLRYYGPEGIAVDTVRADTQSMRGAYTGELQAFTDTALGHPSEGPGVEAARDALRIALGCIASCRTGAPVALDVVGAAR